MKKYLNFTFFVLILSISYILNIFFEDASIFFVTSMSFLCIYNIIKLDIKKSIKFLLIIAFIIRTIFVFVDLYWFRIPQGGSDDDSFWINSLLMRDGEIPFSIDQYGGIWTMFICILSNIIGTKRFGIQFINVIFWLISIIYIFKTLKIIKCNAKIRNIIIIISSYMPYTMFLNGILRRDTLISTLGVISIYHLVYWYKEKSLRSVIICLTSIIVASLIHTAMLFAIPFYIIFFILYNHKKKKMQFNGINLIKQLFLIVLISGFLFYFFANYNTKFSRFDSMEKIYISSTYSRGDSAYLKGIQINNFGQLLLFTPLKVFFFLFSPMPWSLRGAIDLTAFLFDACIYIYLSYIILRNRKNLDILSKNLLMVFLAMTIVFSLGTFTSGTAIRHRYNVLPYILIIYSIVKTNKILNEDINNN